MVDPYATPRSVEEPPPADLPIRYYGGIRRLPYLGTIVLWVLVQVVGQQIFGRQALWPFIVVVNVTGFFFFPAYQRLKNAATNPWACLLLIVPIVNLVILFRCLAYQEGYGEVKRLDRAGRIVAVIFITLFFGLLALMFFGAAI